MSELISNPYILISVFAGLTFIFHKFVIPQLQKLVKRTPSEVDDKLLVEITKIVDQALIDKKAKLESKTKKGK